MISKLKRKIQEITNRLKHIDKKVDFNYALIEDELAQNQLMKLFDSKIFIPLTKWSISPKEVLHICNDIVINKRTSIIEFGSGFSTFCIAQLLKNNELNVSFLSVENNIVWAEELKKTLVKMSLDNYVKVIVSPLRNVPNNISLSNQKTWYHVDLLTEELEDISKFDLVIVDGPIGSTTPYARYSAVPFLKEKLSDDYAVFLDDTHREIEFEIAHEWHKLLGGNIKGYNRYYCLTNKNNFNVSPFGNKY